MARQCAHFGRQERWFDVVVVVGLIGVAREFVVGDCRVGRGGWRTGEDVSSFAIRTNSGCTLVARANGKEDCRCSLQPTHSLRSNKAGHSGQETRLLGRTARRYAVTKLRALPPVMAKCTLLKRDRPSTSGSTAIKWPLYHSNCKYAGDMTGRIR